MRRIGVFLVLCSLMWWVSDLPPGDAPGAHTALVAGLLMLAGHVAGHVLSRIRLPRITGYLCVGLLMGPYLLGYMSVDTVKELGFLNELAITFIALAAGGELKLCRIQPEIYEVFAITKLNRLFEIKEDESDALASF